MNLLLGDRCSAHYTRLCNGVRYTPALGSGLPARTLPQAKLLTSRAQELNSSSGSRFLVLFPLSSLEFRYW